MILVAALVLSVGTAVGLTLFALQEKISLFASPSEILSGAIPTGGLLRLGGLVEDGSIIKNGPEVRFRVSDGQSAIAVSYSGLLPDLFREGQGVVTIGRLNPDGTFRAEDVLAKHDENYMPKEVADSLKKTGHWREQK